MSNTPSYVKGRNIFAFANSTMWPFAALKTFRLTTQEQLVIAQTESQTSDSMPRNEALQQPPKEILEGLVSPISSHYFPDGELSPEMHPEPEVGPTEGVVAGEGANKKDEFWTEHEVESREKTYALHREQFRKGWKHFDNMARLLQKCHQRASDEERKWRQAMREQLDTKRRARPSEPQTNTTPQELECGCKSYEITSFCPESLKQFKSRDFPGQLDRFDEETKRDLEKFHICPERVPKALSEKYREQYWAWNSRDKDQIETVHWATHDRVIRKILALELKALYARFDGPSNNGSHPDVDGEELTLDQVKMVKAALEAKNWSGPFLLGRYDESHEGGTRGEHNVERAGDQEESFATLLPRFDPVPGYKEGEDYEMR